jgi:hypothetical protein
MHVETFSNLSHPRLSMSICTNCVKKMKILPVGSNTFLHTPPEIFSKMPAATHVSGGLVRFLRSACPLSGFAWRHCVGIHPAVCNPDGNCHAPAAPVTLPVAGERWCADAQPEVFSPTSSVADALSQAIACASEVDGSDNANHVPGAQTRFCSARVLHRVASAVSAAVGYHPGC